jgi:hypothetical protein
MKNGQNSEKKEPPSIQLDIERFENEGGLIPEVVLKKEKARKKKDKKRKVIKHKGLLGNK